MSNKLTDLILHRYLNSPTPAVYKAVMEKRGLQPDIVPLPHDTEGYWLGNKDAKNVVVFYHGMYKSILSSTQISGACNAAKVNSSHNGKLI